MNQTSSPSLDSLDSLREHAYLVARGVRPLALVGQCENAPLTMLRTATAIEGAAESGAIPFVIDRGDGYADYGFAVARWALDLFRWITNAAQDAVPDQQRTRILGLLFGYSAESIRLFDESQDGRMFQAPTVSAGPGSSSRPGGTRCRAGKSRRD